MQEIVSKCFSHVTPVARIYNANASEANSLGKYFGIVSMAMDDAGNFSKHNINVPNKFMFNQSNAEEMALSYLSNDPTLNNGSLLKDEKGELLQLIFQVNQAYKLGNTNAAGHWFSTRWLIDKLKIAEKRNEQIENLVFDRLVKNAN